MREALAAVGGATLVYAADGDAVAALRRAAGTADLVLLLIEPGVPNPDRTMLLAAIGPLAVDLAPTGRIAALDIAEGADSADVAAAAAFLVAARSTTGQVLRIG